MWNQGFHGQLAAPSGGTIADLRVEVLGEEIFPPLQRVLGSTVVGADGSFEVTYFPVNLSSLTLRITNRFGREIVDVTIQAAQESIEGVFELTAFGGAVPLSFTAQQLDGWVVVDNFFLSANSTDAGHVCPVRICGAEALVDNHAAWGRLADAVGDATSVRLTQLHWETDYLIARFTPDPPDFGVPTDGDKIDLSLKMLASAGGEALVLMNDFTLFPYPADTLERVTDTFLNSDVQVLGFPMELRSGAMHAKTAVVDGTAAFLVASPFLQEYFDASELTFGASHRIGDPRRGEMNGEVGLPFNVIMVPIHDVSVRLDGPAVIDVDESFRELWDAAGGAVPSAATPGPATGEVPVQILRSVPGGRLPNRPEGEARILEAYLRAIEQAQDYIYLENQYVTEPLLADAMALALQERPELQVILLCNFKVDLPMYADLQRDFISRLLVGDGGMLGNRIGIYTLWTHESDGVADQLMRNYVHSKTAIVDGAWATIGSANLDGVSLNRSQFILPLLDDDRRKRAIELNAIIYNGVDGLPNTTFPDDLRRRLWAEHLGFADVDDPQLTERPSGGWQQLWRDLAFDKVSQFDASIVHPARVLPWPKPFAKPDSLSSTVEEQYLTSIGIPQAAIAGTVIPAVQSFSFATGNWIN